MRRLAPLLTLALTCCTYGPPVYHGKIQSIALMEDGGAAISYLQLVSRQPTGLSTFPDGGATKIDYEKLLVARVDRDGRTREIARFDNEALPGLGYIHVVWASSDPDHLYLRFAGQLSTRLPIRSLSKSIRMTLNGRRVAEFDLAGELAQQGREFGAAMFGGDRIMDARGTMLVGATRGQKKEVWRRDPEGSWTLLDWFDLGAEIVGDDLVYFHGTDQLARNWRTGAVRRIAHFNKETGRREEPNRFDPVLRPRPLTDQIQAFVSDDGHSIEISRNNMRVRVIHPDLGVLDAH
jgi:hypothetical protein